MVKSGKDINCKQFKSNTQKKQIWQYSVIKPANLTHKFSLSLLRHIGSMILN